MRNRKITEETVKEAAGPLEFVQSRRHEVVVYFNPNPEAYVENMYVSRLVIDLADATAILDGSAVYTSNGTPLEVLDSHTRVAAMIRILGITIGR